MTSTMMRTAPDLHLARYRLAMERVRLRAMRAVEQRVISRPTDRFAELDGALATVEREWQSILVAERGAIAIVDRLRGIGRRSAIAMAAAPRRPARRRRCRAIRAMSRDSRLAPCSRS